MSKNNTPAKRTKRIRDLKKKRNDQKFLKRRFFLDYYATTILNNINLDSRIITRTYPDQTIYDKKEYVQNNLDQFDTVFTSRDKFPESFIIIIYSKDDQFLRGIYFAKPSFYTSALGKLKDLDNVNFWTNLSKKSISPKKGCIDLLVNNYANKFKGNLRCINDIDNPSEKYKIVPFCQDADRPLLFTDIPCSYVQKFSKDIIII